MPPVLIMKIVFLVIISILAFVTLIAKYLVPEKKYKDQAYRVRVIVRIKMICFLVMLVLLLLVMFIK